LAPQLGFSLLRDFNLNWLLCRQCATCPPHWILWPTQSFCPFGTSCFMISQVPLQSLRDFHLRNPNIGIHLQIQWPLWLRSTDLLLLSLEPLGILIITPLLLHEIW
jgi:hypothetical protein